MHIYPVGTPTEDRTDIIDDSIYVNVFIINNNYDSNVYCHQFQINEALMGRFT